MDKPSFTLHSEQAVNYTLFDCKWIPGQAKTVVVGIQPNGRGIIEIYELLSSKQGRGVKLFSKEEAEHGLKACTFIENNLLSCDYQGNIELRDINRLQYGTTSRFKAHQTLINAVDTADHKSRPEVVTGCQQGLVKIWDLRQNNQKAAVIEMKPDVGEGITRECWTVAFGGQHTPEEGYVCAGFDSGDIKVFDLRKCSVYWEMKLKNGICSSQFDRKDIRLNKLVTVGLQSSITVFDLLPANTNNIKYCTQKAHDSTIWSIKHLPQNRDVFVTCGGSGSLMLWKYEYPEKRLTIDQNNQQQGAPGKLNEICWFNFGTQPVNSFDWNDEMLGLACATSFDQRLRIIVTTKLNTI